MEDATTSSEAELGRRRDLTSFESGPFGPRYDIFDVQRRGFAGRALCRHGDGCAYGRSFARAKRRYTAASRVADQNDDPVCGI